MPVKRRPTQGGQDSPRSNYAVVARQPHWEGCRMIFPHLARLGVLETVPYVGCCAICLPTFD